MKRRSFVALLGAAALAACTQETNPVGPDGRPAQKIYRIKARDHDKIRFRVLDSINALRRSAGHGELQLDAKLNAAAETHSKDMALQNRPWHFGSDGSSPLDRVARVGYPGHLVGENISETYEDEVETLAAWMQDPNTRAVILNPAARKLGFAWFQEKNGKIWWTLITGS